MDYLFPKLVFRSEYEHLFNYWSWFATNKKSFLGVNVLANAELGKPLFPDRGYDCERHRYKVTGYQTSEAYVVRPSFPAPPLGFQWVREDKVVAGHVRASILFGARTSSKTPRDPESFQTPRHGPPRSS